MKSINLWPESFSTGKSKGGEFVPKLDIYTLEKSKTAGAVVICPGGAYEGRVAYEGKDVALHFNKLGFHAFVLQYRVSPNRFPAPQEDIFRAIKIVRSRADAWNVKSDKIAVCGFSAGGHLAASSGILFDEVEANASDEVDKYSQTPNALILCYPVILAGKYSHIGSFDSLLGKEAEQELREKYSLEKRITMKTPPTFLWHTAEDEAVPVENSLFFALELRKYKIPFELHIFPEGRHGLGLGMDSEISEVQVWSKLCGIWLKKMNW